MRTKPNCAQNLFRTKNIKQDDVKDALREKHFKTGLHDLELVEESATAKGGKLNLNVPRELQGSIQ